MKVIHFHRKPREGFYSIENIYKNIRATIQEEVKLQVVEMPFYCTSHFGKLCNLIYVLFFKADVYHITGDIHYVAAFLPRRQTIITAHSVEGGRPKLEGWRKRLFLYLYFFRPNRHCQYWTAVSQFTKKELSALLGVSDKIEVIYNPISPIFKEEKTLPKSTANFEILLVGTHPRKQNERVFEAVKTLDNIHLTVVGILPERQQYWMDKLEMTVIPSASETDMQRLYLQSDVLVIASNNESFCMPIVEAQKLGLPVITSNAAAMPEIAGKAAIVVEPSVEALRKAIQKMQLDEKLRQQLIAEGKNNAKRFELENIAQQYLAMYKLVFKYSDINKDRV